MTIYEVLDTLSIPWVYGRFLDRQAPPFAILMGSGQDVFSADNTYYHRSNSYRVEYYFTAKNESLETEIEDALLAGGFKYEKSEDLYIESEDIFSIYYYIH